MFNKILIANRGEIACRVIKTARRMGIATVAVYSEADANARHVAPGRRGGADRRRPRRASPTCSAQKILDAAKATGAQAVHPGYGFLSENADFAEACAAAGIVFIGPPASRHPRDGQQVGRQGADGQGRRAADARLPRRQDRTRAVLAAQADAHRLPGADQGQRRRWRQGHAPRRRGGRLRSRAGLLPARGARRLRRRPGAGREVRAAARGISRSRCSATATATACTCSSATARCSAATRRCWRKRPRRA